MDRRSALCEIRRASRSLDRVDGWRGNLVAHDNAEKCIAELNAHGVPCSAYRTVAEALRDPQLAHRGALAEVEDNGGTFKVVNLPFRMSGTRIAAGKRAAALGEHTVALLRESGLSEERIVAMVGKSPMAERC